MQKNSNLILAVVFMIGFLMLWDHFVISKYGPPRPQHGASAPAATQAKENAALSAMADQVIADNRGKKASQAPFLTITAPNVEVTFETAKARVASWKLKEGAHWLEMVVREKDRTLSPLETFPDLEFIGEKLSESQVVFTASRPDGLIIKKTVSLLTSPPYHSVSLTLINPSNQPVDVQTDLGWGSGIDHHASMEPYNEKENGALLAQQKAVAYRGQVQRWRAGLIVGRTVQVIQPGDYDWVGVGNNHFMALLLADGDKIPSVRILATRKSPPVALASLHLSLKPKSQIEQHYQLYVGPKNYEELKKMGRHLEEAVDFGLFGFISKVLLFLLNKFEAMTHNYGWAIIILTFLIQLVVFPLTIKNFKHSSRMKELQPQLKKIQDQFKSDPKRLQAETFNLYRKNGMKFMGMEGCFPMLLQIPLFFAFYSTLNVAYELRGAPWIFWIKDLAAHDPYYVLPILMGLGMFLQQKVTSAAIDPAQARMMMFMPLMFTFMFLRLPAGLVLYWCVNSLTTIVIQQFMRKRHSPPTPA